MSIRRRKSQLDPSQVNPVIFEALEPRLLLDALPGFTQIDPLASNIYQVKVAGVLEATEYSDQYDFTAVPGEHLSVGVTTTDASLDITILLINMDTDETSVIESRGPGESEYGNRTIVMLDGNYRFELVRKSGSGNYNLTVVRNAFINPDEFGGPANDSAANAFDLDSGLQEAAGEPAKVAVYSDAAATEDDYFSFTLADGETVTLLVDSTSAGDVQVVLSKDGTDIDPPGVSGPISYVSNYTVPVTEAGTYIVKVSPATAPGYTLMVIKNAAMAVTDITDIDTPLVIESTSTVVGGVGVGQMQYYSFEMVAEGDIALYTYTPYGSSLDTLLLLMDDVNVSVAVDYNSAPDGMNGYIFQHLEAGWYKVGVGPDAASGGAYGLRLETPLKVTTPLIDNDESIADGEWVETLPATVDITFSADLDPESVTAEDLIFTGVAPLAEAVTATNVTVNGNKATFTLPTGLEKGSYSMKIAKLAIEDVDSNGVTAFSSIFFYSDPITATVVSPVDDEWFTDAAPTEVTIDFSADLDEAEVSADDLIIKGGLLPPEGEAATGYSRDDGDTYTFTLPTGLIKGAYTIEMAADAVYDADGVGLAAFSSSFEYTGPVTVISTSIQPGQTIPPGTLRFEIQFSRNLFESVLDPTDVLLQGGSGSYDVLAENFEYDSATQTLKLKYTDVNLDFDAFTLSLFSGDDAFRGLAGEGPGGRYNLGFVTEDLAQGRPDVISFGGGAPAIYTDFNGNEVRISLSGPGAGEVHFETDYQGYPTLVKVVGTTGSSYLTITTAAGVETIIQKIEVEGPLAAITGRTTDLASHSDEPYGQITVDGRLSKLILDDLLGDTKITINDSNSAVGSKFTAVVTFDEVENCDLTFKRIPISTLTATRWADGDISAPWIKTVRIKGDRSRGIRGDFGGHLKLSGYFSSKSPYALHYLYVAGKATTADITATNGGIKLIDVAQWDAGTIRTGFVRKIHSKGSVRDQLAGDFGATLTLSRYYFSGRTLYSLDTLLVAGNLFNASGQSTIYASVKQIKAKTTGESLDIKINGLVKVLHVTGNMDGTFSASAFGSIKTNGELSADITATQFDGNKERSINTLKAVTASDATIDALRGIGLISIGQWDGGSIKAGWISNLSVHGRTNVADGRFNADLELTGAGSPKYALTNASIAGAITGDDGIDNSGEGDAADKNITWDITGDVRTINIRGDVSNWKLDVNGDVRSLRMGAVSSTEAVAIVDPDDNDDDIDDNTFYTDIAVTGDIYNFSIVQWDTGKITASAIHSMSTRRFRGAGGQLANATIILTGSYGRSATALGRLTVNGNITDTTITASTGEVGNIRMWNWDGGKLAASDLYRISSIKADNDFTAELDIVGVVRYATIAGDLKDAQWSARIFYNIFIKQQMLNSTISASQSPHSSYYGIGSLNVKYDIVDSHIESVGHIRSIQAGAMKNTTIFAGDVTKIDELPDPTVDSVWDMPETGDLYLGGNSRANISRLTVTGKSLSGLTSGYFDNTNVAAAGDMGTIILADYKMPAAETDLPFGLTADRIGYFKLSNARLSWKNLETQADADAGPLAAISSDTDFTIRLV